MPEATVIVATRDRADFLRDCLACLARQSALGRFDVIVVDNGSTDATPAVIAQAAAASNGSVRGLTVAEANRGKARNAGLAAAGGRIIIFCDDDTLPPEHFVEAHLAAHASAANGHAAESAVSGPIINVPDGRSLPAPGPANFSRAFFCTCNVSAPKRALEQIGGFDERYDLYGWEDTDVGVRLRAIGLRRSFAWGAYIYHVKPPEALPLDRALALASEKGVMAARFIRKTPSFAVKLATGAYTANYLRAAVVHAPPLRSLYTKWARERPPASRLGRFGREALIDAAYLDAIGDALVATPLIAALQENGHDVGIVLSDANAGVFNSGALLAVHVLERIPWPRHGSTAASHARTLAELRERKYDVALIASEEPEAYAIAREALISERIGFHNGWQKPFKSLWIAKQCTSTIYRPAWAARAREHEVETLFKLGVRFVASSTPPRDRALLARLLLAAVPDRDTSVVVQLTPKWRASGISDEALVSALRALASRDLRAVAAQSERDFATAIAARASVALEVFATLEPWKIAVARAATIVTPDTGSAHLAGMLGTPCVDCFPHADFVLREKRWSPWAAPYVALSFPPGTSDDAIASRVAAAASEVVRRAA